MGNKNSGRRPAPTSLKVLRGNPGKRPLNASEPAFAVASPAFDAVPPELSADSRAADEWRRLAPMLRAVRMVSEAERSARCASNGAGTSVRASSSVRPA
jgi:phage terminase small subunit